MQRQSPSHAIGKAIQRVFITDDYNFRLKMNPYFIVTELSVIRDRSSDLHTQNKTSIVSTLDVIAALSHLPSVTTNERGQNCYEFTQ